VGLERPGWRLPRQPGPGGPVDLAAETRPRARTARRPHVARGDLRSMVAGVEAVRRARGPPGAVPRAPAGRRPPRAHGHAVQHAERARPGAGDPAWLH